MNLKISKPSLLSIFWSFVWRNRFGKYHSRHIRKIVLHLLMRRNCTILNQVYRMLFVTNTSSPIRAKLLRSLNEFIDTVNYNSQPRWIPEYISLRLGRINHKKLTNECYPIYVHHQQDIQIHSCMLSLVYWNFPCHYIYFELQSSLFPNQIHTLPTLVSTIWLAKNYFTMWNFVPKVGHIFSMIISSEFRMGSIETTIRKTHPSL